VQCSGWAPPIGPFAACFTWRARGAACDVLRSIATRLSGCLHHRPCGMVVQQEAMLATLWLLGSNCWLLCNVLRRWRLYVRAVCTRG